MIDEMILLSDLGRGPLYLIMVVTFIFMGVFKKFYASTPPNFYFLMAWQLSAFWIIGAHLNLCLKYLLAAPRPWWIDPTLLPLHPSPAKGFGMPSGHAQSAVGIIVFALSSCKYILKNNLWVQKFSSLIFSLSIAWVIGMMCSRVVLNAHSIAQVFAGATVGLLWWSVVAWVQNTSRGWIVLLLCSVIFGIVSLFIVLFPPIVSANIVSTLAEHQVSPPHSLTLLSTAILTGASCSTSLCLLLLRKSGMLKV